MDHLQHPTTKQIRNMIASSVPVIALLTPEEARAEQHLISIADSLDYSIYSWAYTTGLWKIDPLTGEYDKGGPIENTNHPDLCIAYILETFSPSAEHKHGVPAIFVLKDMHPFMTGERAEPVVVRGVRDLSAMLETRVQTAVLLSPSMAIPPDLEKDVAVVEFPLPTIDEIQSSLETIAAKFEAKAADAGREIPIDVNGGTRTLANALAGLTEREARSVIVQAVKSEGRLDAQIVPFVSRQKERLISQSPALQMYQDVDDFSSVGGLDLLSEWANRTALSYTERARAFGLTPPRGVLLVGVPGCGKSLSAKAIAAMMQVPLVRLDFGALYGSLVGESESRARGVIKLIEAVGRCVFWWDELEKGLAAGGDHDGGTSTRVFGTFLTWMQETTSECLIVATANDVSRMPPEFFRRFTEKFFVDLPESEARKEIAAIHLHKRQRSPRDFDLERIANHTRGFTGDEIEKAVEAALALAFSRQDEDITTETIVAVAKETKPLSESMAGKIGDLRSWAEQARPASSRQESGGARRTSRDALDVVDL